MSKSLQIYIDNLKQDKIIKEKISSKDLDIEEEKELIFKKDILIEGKAFLLNKNIIINLNIEFFISMPCSICNRFIEKKILIKNLYIIEKIANIKYYYDLKDEIRNACFLEIPSYAECNNSCPERQYIKKYLSKKNKNYPFEKLKE